MGGTGTLSYSLTGDIPEGLAFTADNRVLRGTPMTASDAVILTYTVTDEALPAASDFLTVSVTVNAVAPAAPTDITLVPKDAQIVVSWTARTGCQQRRRHYHRLHRHSHRYPERRHHVHLYRHWRRRHHLRQSHHRPDQRRRVQRHRGRHQQCRRQRAFRSANGDARRATRPGPDITLDPGTIEIAVSWMPILEEDNGGAPIIQYTATARAENQTPKSCTAFGARATTCTITGLTSGVRYQVTVRAVNSFGDGAPSTAEAVTDIETESEIEKRSPDSTYCPPE